MRVVIQRVLQAEVKIVQNKDIQNTVGKIKKGLLVFLGVGQEDTKEDVERLVKKIVSLRIFEDAQGKTNLSIQDVSGELLVVSQFTLYADCKKGNRPSFVNAANPELANTLYEYFIEKCREVIPTVETGIFGADMKVSLVNDGPFTILL